MKKLHLILFILFLGIIYLLLVPIFVDLSALLLSTLIKVIVVFGVIVFFVIYLNNRVKKKNIVREHKNLKRVSEITKNGVVINVEDETEEYSVKKCPYCQEEINKDAIKCKHCGEGVGKGYEIIADGTYVANKIQDEWTSGQSSENKQSGNLFFRVIWITLTVLIVIFLFNIAILTTFLGAIFG